MTSDFKGLMNNGNTVCAERQLLLVILDGVGNGRRDDFDAVARARTPNLNWMQQQFASHSRALRAHGVAVGLPSDGDVGNSEVGHNILGAGRIFDQGAKCVETAIRTGTIWNGVWQELVADLKNSGGTLHLLGLLSDGNVHSHIDHVHAMLERAAQDGLKRVRIHVLFDGRDVPEGSAETYVEQLEQHLLKLREGHGFDYCIASGGGRMVTTMDRYQADWRIVERGWRAHVLGDAPHFASTKAALEHARENGFAESDQNLPPYVVANESGPVGTIEDGDAVLLFNFRGDRAIEISQAFQQGAEFKAFDRERVPKVFYAGMMLYDGDEAIPARYLVQPEVVTGTMSELLAEREITQFACAETQKYGHVTYFWNGNRSGKFNDTLESYVEISSDTCPFNERPWMKAAETADEAIKAMQSGKFRFSRVNFAGGDMVGHTGDLSATTLAIESIDLSLGRILRTAKERGACVVVTADHGNADDMVQRDKSGAPVMRGNTPIAKTSHSLNEVPFVIADFANPSHHLINDIANPGLGNVASTLIELLGYQAPPHFEPSLIGVGPR